MAAEDYTVVFINMQQKNVGRIIRARKFPQLTLSVESQTTVFISFSCFWDENIRQSNSWRNTNDCWKEQVEWKASFSEALSKWRYETVHRTLDKNRLLFTWRSYRWYTVTVFTRPSNFKWLDISLWQLKKRPVASCSNSIFFSQKRCKISLPRLRCACM